MNRKDVPVGINQLPAPDEEAQRHSLRLIEKISAAMQQQGGSINFECYMHMALYEPGLGYYSAGKRKLGAAGDFITAPEISPLFSRCVAKQCQQVLEFINGGDILEFGGGTGIMAAEVLRTLADWKCLPDRYLMLDVSADLRQAQYATLKNQVPELLARVVWLDRLPEQFSGVVLANEVLDAMPVNLLGFNTHNLCEYRVTQLSASEGFSWLQKNLTEGRLRQQVEKIIADQGVNTFVEGYISEINLLSQDWIKSLASIVKQGLILLIDYGFPCHEYYHHERYEGTLMCHYRHRTHSDPLILPGLQDITAHVDFSAIAATAIAAGLDLAGYTSQANFLLAAGLPDILEQAIAADTSEQIYLNQQVKKLTLTHEMGELFKVMALVKDLELPLTGFSMNDRSYRL